MQKNHLPHALQEFEVLLEDTFEACHEDVEDMKIDLQNQLHDIFNELKLLRREIMYLRSPRKK